MKTPFTAAVAAALLLSACGFKGSLYLPKESDKAKFGAVQTGLQLENQPITIQPEVE
ncbi:LPS translocon maturation chaperone LptM [Neisseria elongata]|jgi:hypothetical protein|uniref:LPS translocon maturation chaperone LptM n=1 Tax=Neisseria elongata TaxID=495 RepID=UPI00195E2837|nr:lipoprotein [Neisseria elongata]MBM7064164.1 lipoprotein [Neisseria elongata]